MMKVDLVNKINVFELLRNYTIYNLDGFVDYLKEIWKVYLLKVILGFI